MLRFVFNFFFFGLLFYAIWHFAPEAFQSLVSWAEVLFKYIAHWVQVLFEQIRGSTGGAVPPVLPVGGG